MTRSHAISGEASARVEPRRDSSIAVRTLILLGGILLVCGSLFYLSRVPANQDVAWYAYLADRVLTDHVDFYRDVFEINPPLVVWFAIPPAALARVAGLDPLAAYRIWIFALMAVSAGLCWPLLRRTLPENARPQVALAVLFVGLVLPLPIFGQREHVLWVATLPYVLLAVLRTRGETVPTGRALAIGALGALGFALKPFFVLPWLFLEAYLLVAARNRQTWRRPEVAILLALVAVYLGLAVVLAQEYVQVIELARATYHGYNVSIGRLLVRRETIALAVAIALVLGLKRAGVRLGPAPPLLLAVGTGFLAAGFAQGKGWGYQMYPSLATSALAVACAGVLAIDQVRARTGSNFVGRAALPIGCTLVGAWMVVSGVRAEGIAEVQSLRSLGLQAQGEAVYFLSTSVKPGFPLVNETGTCWFVRFNCLWPLPGFYPDRSARSPGERPFEEMSAQERAMLVGVVDDLERDPPRLLFVDRSSEKQGLEGRDFDLITYVSQEPRFPELFQRYDFLSSVGSTGVWRLRDEYPAARCDELWKIER